MSVDSRRLPSPRPTPLPAVLALTLCASFSTGVFWNGMPFISESDYQFSEWDNFLLFLVVGVIYVAAAINAGGLLRVVERRLRPRSVLACLVALQALVCFVPLVADAAWMVWVVTSITSALSALFWPVVESYLSAGKSGARLRFSIGLWNVTWTSAVAASLICMIPFMRPGEPIARYAVVALGGLNILGLITLIWFNRTPVEHGDETAGAEVGPEYALLLRSARMMLPVSYILVAMLSPMMPYRLQALDVGETWMTAVAATWMIARVGAIIVMWRAPFWHGRWGTLLLSGVAMTIGFMGLILAPNLPVMFIGLALFGAGQGMSYYTALYYAMSVGKAAVDAGGTHEGLIGLGYAAGPALGLASLAVVSGLKPDDPVAALALVRTATIVAIMLGCAWLATRPYLRALRARAQ